MKILKFINVILFILFGISIHAETQSSTQLQKNQLDPVAVVAYTNSFTSIDSMLNELVELNLVSKKEVAGVIEVLAKNNIPLSTQIIPARIDSTRFYWGKTLLVSYGSGIFKNKNGDLLRFDKYASFDQVFSETLQALTLSKTASLFNEFVNQAQAATIQDTIETVSAAASVGAYHAMKFVFTPANGIGAAIANDFGYPAEIVLVGLRNWKYKNTITCNLNKEYSVHNGYKNFEWKKYFDKWVKDHKDREKNDNYSKVAAIGGQSLGLRASYLTGRKMLDSAFSPEKNPETAVDKDLLKLAWPNEKIPDCTKENANKLKASIDAQATQMEKQIKVVIKESVNSTTSQTNDSQNTETRSKSTQHSK